MFPIRRISHEVRISRELAMLLGIVEPTPAETDARARLLAEHQARKAEAQPRLHAALAALDAIAGPDRAILDLHARTVAAAWPECAGCDFGGYEGEPPS